MVVWVYALDALVRDPTWRRAALAALAFAFTVCMKYSGLALLPILAVLIVLEGISRWREPAWRVALMRAAGVFTAVAYLLIVAIYMGDWRLSEYTAGLGELAFSVLGEGRTAFLLGESRSGGWWYFFPVAFVLKTPLGLHVLAAIAAVAAVMASRGTRWRTSLAHPLRAPIVALALLVAATMSSRMNIGMRHALPVLPFACIVIAQGVAWMWERGGRASRALTSLAVVALAASTMRAYPYFLSYLSEYAYGRPVHETLVDSNTDWGQGLVALRNYMREHGIDRVQLGYFGTAMPRGYGIDYVQMPSYFQLPEGSPGPRPRFAVVSATLLAGVYMFGDPYAPLRKEKPVAVVGGSLYVFDTQTFGRR
jgi:hypothetical protein